MAEKAVSELNSKRVPIRTVCTEQEGLAVTLWQGTVFSKSE